MALPKIPLDIKTLTKAGQLFESDSASETTIDVFVEASASRELVSLCRKVLQVRPGTVTLTVSSFSTEMPTFNKESSLTIVVAGTSPLLRRAMEIALWSSLDCVFLSEDVEALISSVPDEDAIEIAKNTLEVDTSKSSEEFEHNLAQWCITRLPDLRMRLGAAFPFMRHAIAADLTFQTSLENAVIAAVFFLPGADLPVLTLNQCKLLYQIAVINEVPLSRERLADVAVIVASAFGMRSLTRLALHKLGPVGWLVRGSISLGATLAIGHLANELYSRGGGVYEMIQGTLGKGNSDSQQDDTTELTEEEPSGTQINDAAVSAAASVAEADAQVDGHAAHVAKP